MANNTNSFEDLYLHVSTGNSLNIQSHTIYSKTRSRKICQGVNFNNLTYIAPTAYLTNRTVLVDFCLLNTRSVKNKASIVKDYVVDNNIDLLALTESWLRPGNTDANVINELCPTGYQFLHVPRQLRTGGGVALLYKKAFRIKKQSFRTNSDFTSFEHINMLMRYSSTDLRIVIVYRTSQAALFFDEFATFLECLSITSTPLLIAGDFNFHVDVNHDLNARRFLDLLNTFNLKQHIYTATHRSGHTLDLIITRADDKFVSNFKVYDPVISDHLAVHCQLALAKPSFEKKEIYYRKLRSINKTAFRQDILKSSLLTKTHPMTISELVDLYNIELSSLLDQHAPPKKKIVILRPAAPWYSEEIRKEKSKRRKLEGRWRNTRLTIDRDIYIQQCNTVNNLISSSKKKFYSSIITENKSNAKVLFSCFNKLVNKKSEKILPHYKDPRVLANRFADFFAEKISRIRTNLNNVIENSPPERQHSVPSLTNFEPTNSKELLALISTSVRKSSVLDPIPGTVMSDCLHVLLPVITRIVNLSLTSGTVPPKMKQASLSPLLKRALLNHEEFPNYRPISNLPFISKCTEKVVASRLNEHVIEHNLSEVFQSAYKKCHSTESALVRVHNDILRAIDDGCCVILLLLDLSAAFDTVDHAILLSRLRSRFGVSGTALAWFDSYLSDRSQFVSIDGKRSSERGLISGVPQGSVLGPLLYLLYTSPLGEIVRQHGLSFHFYADDTQIYLTFRPLINGSMEYSKNLIQECTRDISSWMKNNKLKLNDDKTDLLVLTAKHRPQPPIDSIALGSEVICPSETVKNLGTVFDTTLSLEKQVTAACKAGFHHLRNIARIKKHLSFESNQVLIHAFVTSKLDYCNSLYYGLPDFLIKKLQYVQNSAARLLTGSRKYDHVTPILKELHWLPVQHRITFKILTLTYKTLNTDSPQYLKDLLQPYVPTRNLRSSTKNLLSTPKFNLKTYGARAFSISAPTLWNQLPDSIRHSATLDTFKSRLKTFLFKQAFL